MAKLIAANAVNMLRTVVNNVVSNVRKKTDAELRLPPLLDRAYIVFHETGAMQVEDWQEDGEHVQ